MEIKPDLLVEVGAAGGMFCEEAIKSNFFGRVVGVEPGKVQAETCRSKGIDYSNPLEGLEGFEEKAQIVTSFETIEHVFSPFDFLKNCRQLLTDGGLLVLTCPNYFGFDIMTLGVKSDSLDAEHINMFNPSALQKLVEKIGFKVLEIETPGQLDAEIVRTRALNGDIELNQQPFLKSVLIDSWESLGDQFQTFLQHNNLSSHMWLVAHQNKLMVDFRRFRQSVNLMLVIDHAGRAGNGFFQTIFDKHPQVVVCPWIHYIYSYIIEEFGDKETLSCEEVQEFLATNDLFFSHL